VQGLQAFGRLGGRAGTVPDGLSQIQEHFTPCYIASTDRASGTTVSPAL
jgi:hypothetical protein